jgi:hypothetical protein
MRPGQGVDGAGAGVGRIVGIQLALADQGEAGLLQCATGCVVGGLRDGHDRCDFRIEAEDVRYEAGDGGGPEASPALRGLVKAGCPGDADGTISVGVVLMPVALDDANRVIGPLDDEDPGRVGAVRSGCVLMLHVGEHRRLASPPPLHVGHPQPALQQREVIAAERPDSDPAPADPRWNCPQLSERIPRQRAHCPKIATLSSRVRLSA